ncbi:MFS transporter [Allorhizobium taibaishanense]|uniref:Fucose permease n=1 Tax=Allorhizobium taibaishanense TaxID=887144 RepID=A0A1Q9ABF9_9HYPH|nr:MFS transporter [Allorhizobium taibaishanense]MBB4010175.1 fucose permease [Allorhizobium taibaishanense]OLP52176.1 hypothetical protein BJF91_02775 [Allorhizobium taibaishanense]
MIDHRLLLGASASISFFFWGMLGVSIGALLPNAMHTFALSPLLAGMVFVAWSLGFSAGSFAANRLLRIFGTVPVLACLSALTALFALVQFATTASGVFYIVYLLLGLCGGAIFTASHTLFGDLFTERRSSALAILDVVFSLGNMAAPLYILMVLHLQMSWQSFYLTISIGFAAVGGLFVLQLLGPLATGARATAAMTGNDRTSLALSELLFLGLASFSLGAIEWTQNVWFVAYALDVGLQQDIARYGLTAFTAGMIASRIFVMAFASAAKFAWTQRSMLIAALLGELLVLFAGSAPLILVGNFVLGIGIGGLFPIFLGRAMDRNPTASAALSMLMVVSLTVGGQVASFALGAFADHFGVSAAFYVTLPVIATMSVSSEVCRRLDSAST